MKPNEIIGLRSAIESYLGHPLTVHTDFDEFSIELKSAISSSTLKRVWGYNKDHQSISLKSVNILAQYLGYDDYDDFINSDSLASEDHQKLYTASKIAMLAERVHSNRFQYVYEQFSQCRYIEALQTLNSIDEEIKVLIDSSQPYIDSTVSIISELCIKAQIIWSCHYQEEGTIEQICELFEQAVPLAKSINDHFSLWYIYEHWAYWTFLSDDFDRALELNEFGIKQAKILLLEKDEDDASELAFSLNDKAYFLLELGEYANANDVIEEAMEYSCEIITQCYILLNYAKANIELQLNQQSEQKVDYEKIYKDIVTKVNDYHSENQPTNESVHLLLITYFNLGVYIQEFAEEQEIQTATDYYHKAIEVFNSRHIPDPRHQSYYEQCVERLHQIDN